MEVTRWDGSGSRNRGTDYTLKHRIGKSERVSAAPSVADHSRHYRPAELDSSFTHTVWDSRVLNTSIADRASRREVLLVRSVIVEQKRANGPTSRNKQLCDPDWVERQFRTGMDTASLVCH